MNKDRKFILSFVIITVLFYAADFLIPSISQIARDNIKNMNLPKEEALPLLKGITNKAYVTNRSMEWTQLFLYKALVVWRSTYFNKIKNNTLIYFAMLAFITWSGMGVIERILESLSYYSLLDSKLFHTLFGPSYNIIDFIPLMLAGLFTTTSHFYGRRYSFKRIDSDGYIESKNYIYMKKSSKLRQHWRALINGLPSGDFGFVFQGKLSKFNRINGKLEYVPFHNNNKYCLKEIPTSQLIFEHNVSKLKKFNKNKVRLCKKLGYDVKQIFRNNE